MKFMHISDLHLGKSLNGQNLLKEQEFILNNIINTLDCNQISYLLISGDIYQRSAPSDEAIVLFEKFLINLKNKKITTFIIPGNHDSSLKVSYLKNFLKDSSIYIANGDISQIDKIVLHDEFGEVNVYLLPYLKLHTIKRLYSDVSCLEEGIKKVIDSLLIDKSKRNIILSHQYITNSIVSKEEELYLGNEENISASVFDDFDYVALGHIHTPQVIVKDKIIYSGSIYKYSADEVNQLKQMVIVNMGNKGSINVSYIPYTFLNDVRYIKGLYLDVINLPDTLDYLHIELLDEFIDPDARINLAIKYPHIFRLTTKEITNSLIAFNDTPLEEASGVDLFKNFYLAMTNNDISDNELEIVKNIFKELTEEKE